MRLKTRIKIIKKMGDLPANFRQAVAYFIKDALSKSGKDGQMFVENWYSKNIMKPFTFSTYFPINKQDQDHFNFIFSTNDPEFLARLYNGLTHIANQPYELSNFTIKIDSCTITPPVKFESNTATFKTISPILIRDFESHSCYLYPADDVNIRTKTDIKKFSYWKEVKIEDFKHHMTQNLRTIAKHFLGINGSDVDIKIASLNIEKVTPVLHGSNNEQHPYKITYPGIKGEMTIQAPPKVLELFYDIGIGSKRSEGFGMLEVKEGKQWQTDKKSNEFYNFSKKNS